MVVHSIVRRSFLPRTLVRQPSVSRIILLASATLAMPAVAQQRTNARANAPYVPGATWERRDPAAAGFDPTRLTEAIQFAIHADAKAPRDMEVSHYQSFGREPYGQGIGPFKPRGEPTGVILRGGYVVATWGELTVCPLAESSAELTTGLGAPTGTATVKVSRGDTVRWPTAPARTTRRRRRSRYR
jgi:hypothetical protein